MYLSAHEDFDHERDHPSALVWAEEGLTFDWAEGNARERRLNVSRASVLGNANASSVRGDGGWGRCLVDPFLQTPP